MDQKFLRFAALWLFPLFACYVASAALYGSLSSDAVLVGTAAAALVELLQLWLEIFGICAIFAFLIAGISRFGVKKCTPLYLICGGALLFKYVACIVVFSVQNGSLDATANWGAYFFSLGLEAALAALCAALASVFFRRFDEKSKALSTASARLSTPFTPPDAFAYQHPFSRTNPVQRAVFWSVCALAAIRLVAFIADDLTYVALGLAWTIADLPVMLLYWLAQIIVPCFAGYFLTLWLSRLAAKK